MSWPTDDELLALWHAGALTVSCGGPEVCHGCEEAELAERFARQDETRAGAIAEIAEALRPSPCRSGCKTRDHSSYAECLKDAALQIGKLT